MNDVQFTASKAERYVQAHSALGLVYFRRGDYDNSEKELEQSTQDNPTPDPSDLYVLGTGLQNMNCYVEAADACHRCDQVAGALQDQCNQYAGATKR